MNRLGTITQRHYLTRGPNCAIMVEAELSDGKPTKTRTQIVREQLAAKAVIEKHKLKEQHTMASAKLAQWKDGVRFNDEKTGAMTAHVDPSNGKLVLRGEGGSLELWDTPQAWLKEVLKVDPEKDVDKLVAQLGEALGKVTWITLETAAAAKPLTPKPAAAASAKTPAAVAKQSAAANQSQEGVDDMATKKNGIKSKTTAKAVPAKKTAKPAKVTKPAVPAGPLPECQCGCGSKVLNAKRNFLQGHDARFHGYIKKYQRGDMKLSEFPALVQSYIRREGVKVGGKAHV